MRDSVLGDLRIAAALAHRLSFGVRISHDDATVLRVRAGVCEESFGTVCVPPCAFRVSVGEAWRLHRQGRCLALCALPDGQDPAIDVELSAGAKAWPGGIYEVPQPERTRLVFATTAGFGVCRTAVGRAGLDLDIDPLIGVIMIQAFAGDRAGCAAARDTLLDVAAEVTVGELLEEAGAGIPQW